MRPPIFRYLSVRSSFFSTGRRYRGQTYEVTFRCPEEEKKFFSQSSAMVTISVGQLIHEGEKFRDTLGAVNKNFKDCTIMIDDSLQFYTENLKKHRGYAPANEEESWRMASEAVISAITDGDNWLNRNSSSINALTIPVKIVRWHQLRMDPCFNKSIEETLDFYKQNEALRAAINKNIDVFLSRHEKNNILDSNYNRIRAEWLCRQYLIEEITGMIHLWPKLSCEYEIYGSERNLAMQAAYDLYIKNKHPGLLKHVALRFNKIKGLGTTFSEHQHDQKAVTEFKPITTFSVR